MEKIRVLFLAASPKVSPVGLDEEIREITAKIRAADHRDSLEVISRWAVRPDDLQQYLLEHQPHVLHFSGHGTTSEELVLLDNKGNPKPVSNAALSDLLRVLKGNLRLVVLNACFSRPQAEAIARVIECAVGMNRAVGDEAAIRFAAAFYLAIGFGRSIQEAFDLGRSALLLEGIPEENTPVLLCGAGVDPASTFLIRPNDCGHNSNEDPTLKSGVTRGREQVATSRRKFLAIGGTGVISATASGVAYWLKHRQIGGNSVIVKPVDIKLGIKQWIGYTPFAVALSKGLFPKNINVIFKPVDNKASEIPTHLATGKYDIACWTVADHVKTIYENWRSSDDDASRPVAILKVDTSRGADGIIARQDISSVEDLKGKRFSIQKQDVSEFMLRRFCEEKGLLYEEFSKLSKDESAEDAAMTFSTNASFSAAGTYEPLISRLTDPTESGYYVPGAKVILDSAHSSVNGMIVDLALTRHSFLAENEEAIKSFFKGWFQAVEYLKKEDTNALDIACHFNASPTNGTSFDCNAWHWYKPISVENYKAKIKGLTGGSQDAANQAVAEAWPDLNENKKFFDTRGASNEFSEYYAVFEKWCEFLNYQINPKPFDGSFLVRKLLDADIA